MPCSSCSHCFYALQQLQPLWELLSFYCCVLMKTWLSMERLKNENGCDSEVMKALKQTTYATSHSTGARVPGCILVPFLYQLYVRFCRRLFFQVLRRILQVPKYLGVFLCCFCTSYMYVCTEDSKLFFCQCSQGI